MPYRNPSPCTTPGCGRLAPPGRGQCPECRARALRQRAPVVATYNEQWSELSRRFLAEHPECQRVGCTARATETHHIDGLGPSGPRGFDWSNLMALCKRHHSQITASDTGFHTRK
jgi:5-methylcytosine-specific restriction protein A